MDKELNMFLVIGPQCWGRGKTAGVAVMNAKRNWPRGLMRGEGKRFAYDLYKVNDDAFVGALGDLSYPKDAVPILVRSVRWIGDQRKVIEVNTDVNTLKQQRKEEEVH